LTYAGKLTLAGLGLFACGAIGFAFQDAYKNDLPLDHPAIRYYQAPVNDPAARLNQKLEHGDVKLEFREGGLGYLPDLLKQLGIQPDSQALVFSKTSFQASKISPRNPRAIYFSDDVAVGWVRGGDGFEIAAVDPNDGVVFYTLSIQKSDPPRIARRDVCLKCHQGSATLGVPGIFVGSVFPNPAGAPYRLDSIITDHRTAFADRWGGWYVNAKRGEQRDRANAVAPDPADPEALDSEGARNLTSLIRKFDPSGYLSPVSDIVALMTFEHQTQMTNLITRLNWEQRLGWKTDDDIAAMVEYMLFVDEAALAEPVEGVSKFTATFPERGPRDRRGRSLRDFDLKTRLFRYPLSFMIYSAAFQALPAEVKQRVYRRLDEVLSGQDRSGKFTGISGDDRRAILEILHDTDPDWRRRAL
jgi:hypothetical protein